MTTVILLMAGIGSRAKAGKNKMLITINNIPMYQYAIDLFKEFTSNIIIVVSSDDYEYFKSLNLPYKLVLGGNSRGESVLNGLKEVKTKRVLIHDGARILTSKDIIEKCMNSESEAYFVGVKPKATIRYNKSKNYETLNRDDLIEVQTPQGGDTHLFIEGITNSLNNKIIITDDIQALNSDILSKVEYIEGNDLNIKITTPFDIKLASIILGEEK